MVLFCHRDIECRKFFPKDVAVDSMSLSYCTIDIESILEMNLKSVKEISKQKLNLYKSNITERACLAHSPTDDWTTSQGEEDK